MQPSRRRNRLLLLAGIGVVLAGAAGGTYYVRRWQLDREIVAQRDAAEKALAAGDNQTAIDGLGRYLLRFGEKRATSEDYALYAKAREKLPETNGSHVTGAISAYKKAIELDPGARAAQDALLDLYTRSGYRTEALTLVEQMLQATPDDLRLLRIQADVLEALQRLPEALAAARKISGRPNPGRDDLFRTCRLLVRSGTAAPDVDAWLDATATVRAGDPFVELMRAIVLSIRGDTAGCDALIDRAVAGSAASGDPELQLYLLRTLDEIQRFVDAIAVLKRMTDVQDPALRSEIVRRLWYAGEPAEVLSRLTSWDGDLKAAPPEMLAIHALALRRLGRSADMAPFRGELDARTDDAGRAWASFVALDRPDGGVLTADASLRVLMRAAGAVPESGLIQCALGDALAATGELDAAIRAWTSAAKKAPSWYLPHARLGRAYRTSGRHRSALESAHAAVARAPHDLDAMAVWVDVNADAASSLDAPQLARFLDELAATQTAVPQLTAVVLPARVELLARTNAAAARTLVDALLAAPPQMDEDAVLRIAGAAARAGFQGVDRVLALSEKSHGVTPRLAMTAAVLVPQGGGVAGWLATFDAYRARPGAAGSAPDWDVARAGLLEAGARPEAGAAWAQIADANPASVAIQLAALGARSLWKDRTAVARTIDRLKELTGETGATWRVSRARFLIDAPTVSTEEAHEAGEILKAVLQGAPDNKFAHVLLARALQLQGDMDGTEEHLQAAFRLAPDDPSIALDLARIAQWRGNTEEARRKVDAVLAAPNLAPQHAEQAAYMLAAQGDLQRSAQLLERLVEGRRGDASATLALSGLFARLGRTDEAIRLAESLLDRPTAAVVEHTAGLYASVGRFEDADRLLGALRGMQLPPGDAELVQARHAARWGEPGTAAAAYRAAIDADPSRQDAWAAFLEFAVAGGDKAALASVLDDPRTAAIESVRFVASIRDLCDFALADAGLRRLVLAAVRDTAHRPAITSALRAIAEGWSDPARRTQTAAAVRAIAEQNVSVPVLQMVAVDLSAQTSEIHTAVELSRRTAAAFPNAPAPARQWAELLARTGSWSDALDAARLWRDRAPTQDFAPDELIARMLLRLDRAPEAASILEPHAAAATARPADNEDLLVTYAIVLLRTGDGERLAALLGRLAASSERWRARPLEVGPDYLGDGKSALAWMRACSDLVPEKDVNLRLQLVQAWIRAWKKYRTPDLLAGTRAVLAPILALPQPPAGAHFLSGTIAEASGDMRAARADYEAALRANPAFHVARNNLAMLLAAAGQWEDAVDHAQRVVAASPRSPAALDTLGYALRAGGKYEESKARFNEAIALDPAGPAWRVGLAETLFEAGDRAGATAVLRQVEKMQADGVPIPAELAERIARISGPGK